MSIIQWFLLFLSASLLIDASSPTPNFNSDSSALVGDIDTRTSNGTSADKSYSALLSDFDDWTHAGLEQSSYLYMNKSFASGVIVGTGEKRESIQDALEAGYLCVFLRKQRFNVTAPTIDRSVWRNTSKLCSSINITLLRRERLVDQELS